MWGTKRKMRSSDFFTKLCRPPFWQALLMMALLWVLFPAPACSQSGEVPATGEKARHPWVSNRIKIKKPVRIREYFGYMDSLLAVYAPAAPYPLTEHVLVHANPWVLDALVASDYERLIQKDSFLYDQREWIVMAEGTELLLPDSTTGASIRDRLGTFRLDVNIPEFRLRIYADTTLLYSFPVRVGQNKTRYLALSGRMTNLRTQTGTGRIIRHERDPIFIDPISGKRFYTTKRDDGNRTLMPQLPWLETEINGIRNGQMIHPTTNASSLGKAYSNGCIGTSESAAWIIYYHAPLETPVEIRYDLQPGPGDAATGPLADIYGRFDPKKD
jgi:L,D-transpeptidase ErfK/SrfK